jgi:hypothetical protein
VRGHDNGRDLVGTDPWTIQVKRHATMTRGVILAGLAEATASITDDAPRPICIHRGDREPWMVTMTVETLALIAPKGSIFTSGSCGRWWVIDEVRNLPVTMTLEDWCEMARRVK